MNPSTKHQAPVIHMANMVIKKLKHQTDRAYTLTEEIN